MLITEFQLPLNLPIASAFWEKWHLSIPSIKSIKEWGASLPNPPDMLVLFAFSLVSLLSACYILRVVTVGYYTGYRGVWVPVTLMIFLFVIGFGGLVTMAGWIR
jgi:hypothetical protein